MSPASTPSDHSFYRYHRYLLQESPFGYLYRRFLLYPYLRWILGPRFLDVGCGKGVFLGFGNPKQCLGLDINSYNVFYIRKRGLRSDLIDFPNPFPVSDSSFPACILDQVLEHVEDPDYLLSEIYRALQPGAIFLVGLPCEKGFEADPDHKVFYTYDSLCSLVLQNPSFKYERHFYFPFNSRFFGNIFSFNYLYVIFRKAI